MPLTLGLITAGTGLAQSAFGAIQAAKARKEAEARVKGMKEDTGILDYYNKALSRYSANPYQSTYYQNMANQANRGIAAQTTALQAGGLKGGYAGAIGSINQRGMTQLANAAGQAENMSARDLQNLGYASRSLAGERQRIEDTKTNLVMQKWAQKAQLMNQGMQNMYSGLSTAATNMGDGGAGKAGKTPLPKNTTPASYYNRQYGTTPAPGAFPTTMTTPSRGYTFDVYGQPQ